MYGWRGTLLSVDLTDLRIEREALDPGFARQFIGGRGFTSKVLFSRLRPGVDPLSAENVLCLGAGPLSGTSLAMSGRIQAVERAFNIRRGITREDDRLPQKPESSDTREGETDLEKHELMLEEYYRVQGYDPETGMPTRRRLVALNLEDVADALEADAPYPRWEGPPLSSPEQYPSGGRRA